jgi:hypothetical protein
MVLPLLLSFLGSGLAKAGVLGAAGSFLASPLVAGAIGSGLGTAIETGDIKKGLGAGLGSFAGGKLLGGMLGGTAPPPEGVVPPPGTAAPAAAGASQSGIGGLFGGRAGDIARAGMDFGSSAQGIGSMFGGAMGAGLMGSNPKTPTEQGPDISQMRPMQRQANMPGADYVPGTSGEFDYGISTPYTTDYMAQYAPQRMAAGGMVGAPMQNPYAAQYAADRQGMAPPMGMAAGGAVQHMVPGYGPVRMQEGGIANIGATPMDAPAPKPNEREVISAAIAAVQGQHPRPEIALGAFLAQYGEDALRDLVDRVQSGEMGKSAAESEGELAGPGDGMSDMIPASIEGGQDVLLSDGEYIVPADVVSGLGNGSSGAGAKALDNMADKVRVERTGRAKQPPAVPQKRMMPA